jgi:hypothetical protein
MKEFDADKLKRLQNENEELKARLDRAHKNHDALLDGHVLALQALRQGLAPRIQVSPEDAYNGVVQCILAQPGVNPANINGSATMADLGVAETKVGACVNAKFALNPPILNNELSQDTTVGTLAGWVVERS